MRKRSRMLTWGGTQPCHPTPPPATQAVSHQAVSLGPSYGRYMPGMGQMARAWAQKPTHERPTGEGSGGCRQGGRSGRCGWSLGALQAGTRREAGASGGESGLSRTV